MSNGITAPNYTQTPNEVYDLMPEMQESELRVTFAIVRETFGWHRDKAKLSLSRLVALTGISKPSVITGINAGIERGTIQKEPDGEGFFYSLVVKPVDYPSKTSLLEVVKPVDYPQSNQFTDLHLSKERSKKRIKKEDLPASQGVAAQPPAPPPVDVSASSTANPKHRKQPTAYVNPQTGVSTTDIKSAYMNLLLEFEPGAVISHPQAAAAAAALAQAGWTAAQVGDCYRDMRKDPWWKGKAISLQSVAKKIGAFYARNKRPQPPVLTLEAQGIFLEQRTFSPDDFNF